MWNHALPLIQISHISGSRNLDTYLEFEGSRLLTRWRELLCESKCYRTTRPRHRRGAGTAARSQTPRYMCPCHAMPWQMHTSVNINSMASDFHVHRQTLLPEVVRLGLDPPAPIPAVTLIRAPSLDDALESRDRPSLPMVVLR